MANSNFRGNLAALAQSIILEVDGVGDEASFILKFSNGALLQATYWRLLQGEGHHLSSFDHKHRYGLEAPIDAISQLATSITGKIVKTAMLDSQTGDLAVCFSDAITLQILNFTGYEVWKILFPDGSREFSNHDR